MIERRAVRYLETWLQREDRKPLIIRGARQTGKTTLVHRFGRRFEQYVYLNLEAPRDRRLFDKEVPFDQLLQRIYFEKEANLKEPSTLIFIDEIQNAPFALTSLRFFYEERPDIHVIAAGSLLEIYLERYSVGIPVGRVEYLYLFPVSFSEFLGAAAGDAVASALREVPFPEHAFPKTVEWFHTYALTGGMPAVCADYLENQDPARLGPRYEQLLVSFADDAAKYARNTTMHSVIRHALESAPLEMGRRVQYQGFGRSSYRSREMGEALRTLQRAMLLYLVHPITAFEPPALPDTKKSARLVFLDHGLANYRAGALQTPVEIEDLNAMYAGRLIEQIVSQEMLSGNTGYLHLPRFWVREKKGASSETDFVIQRGRRLIPVEAKSGKSGRLRSLLFFMDQVDHDVAVRLYPGPERTDRVRTTGGKQVRLLNLPYFLGGDIAPHVDRLLGVERS